MSDWTIKAKAEGRICPECSQPMTIGSWKHMLKLKPEKRKCYTCRVAHWEEPLYGSGGSADYDNRDRDSFICIRQNGD